MAFCQWVARQDDTSQRNQEGGTEASTSGAPARETEEPEDDKPSDGKADKTGKEQIPEFDGSTTMREYRRRVRLFESVTGISPRYRAGRLLERLSGTAWQAAETLNIEEIKCENGVNILLDHLQSELEPLRVHENLPRIAALLQHL